MSRLAISVIYTMVGLEPIADARPVINRPIIKTVRLFDVAIMVQPIRPGIAANLTAFNLPILSITKPVNISPTGATNTTTLAAIKTRTSQN